MGLGVHHPHTASWLVVRCSLQVELGSLQQADAAHRAVRSCVPAAQAPADLESHRPGAATAAALGAAAVVAVTGVSVLNQQAAAAAVVVTDVLATSQQAAADPGDDGDVVGAVFGETRTAVGAGVVVQVACQAVARTSSGGEPAVCWSK